MFSDLKMGKIPKPIFQNKISKIFWQKIYEREYGVQYSEAAVALLASAKYHFPAVSTDQIVIPAKKGNTAFYIDGVSWIKLVEGLNAKYTSNVKRLGEYEKQFLFDGNNYLKFTKDLSRLNLKSLSNKQLLKLFREHQNKKNRYSVFAWSAFILNNYVAERAAAILNKYIKKAGRESEKQEIIDSLFKPEKRAAILQLQYEVEKHNGKPPKTVFEDLYKRFKWLSCLDLHNKEWTKEEFRKHIKSFTKAPNKKEIIFSKYAKELKIGSSDLEYLQMAKRFVYIKDARDDFRRESVYNSLALFSEIAQRMQIKREDISYAQESEITAFLNTKATISKKAISQRKTGFVIYLDSNKNLVCLQGSDINKALKAFKLSVSNEKVTQITGMVASRGLASGKVSIVNGVKDLEKVKKGDILVAVTTHPDFVPAMRRAVAIVTDEGGVTSHAAIVAREFGLPCIVGTKSATKFLKDGDVVEVNAEEGWVKKLN